MVNQDFAPTRLLDSTLQMGSFGSVCKAGGSSWTSLENGSKKGPVQKDMAGVMASNTDEGSAYTLDARGTCSSGEDSSTFGRLCAF